MSEKQDRSEIRDSLAVRVTCGLLPFEPNGDRVPVSYMEHRLAGAIAGVTPSLLAVAVLAVLRREWMVFLPTAVLGIAGSVCTILMVQGVRTLRKRRRARLMWSSDE